MNGKFRELLTEISKPEDESHEEKKLGENVNMNHTDVKVKPTRLLWLVPIFMGLLGGILMYIAVKDEDQQKANDGILVGILSTIAVIFGYMLIMMTAMRSYMNMIPF